MNTPTSTATTVAATGHILITHAMVHVRTREIAREAGYTPPYVCQANYEQAKRELTGESDRERQNAAMD